MTGAAVRQSRTCWLLLAVVAVHIAGALYHAFRNDGIVRRMLHL